MLIQFRVENHRSLRDEQILRMTALGGEADARLIRVPALDELLLPAVALYGANASGKSNVLDAFGFMRAAVLDSYRFWRPDSPPPREPFALSAKVNEPSLYEADIVIRGVRYRYGFVLGPMQVEEEWLHAWPGGREQVVFAREGDDFEFAGDPDGKNARIRELTRRNSLFLATAAQNNHAGLLPVFRWFDSVRLELRDSRLSMTDMNYTTELLSRAFAPTLQLSMFPDDADLLRTNRETIVRLLRAADVGVLDITTARVEPRTSWRAIGYSAEQAFADRGEYEIRLVHQAEREGGVTLPLRAESAGTLTLLEIAVHLVKALHEGLLVCIDELEASLHPVLALEFVRLFDDPGHNPRGAQLIFTTHDTHLLGGLTGDSPLRRDQIWFTEKDSQGATHLYPLTDFHPRAQENLERGYLQGRYGAIPVLGPLFPHIDDDEDGSERG